MKLLDANGEEIKLAGSELPVNITFQLGSIITVKDGQQVAVGEVLARIPQETSKTRDITGGLPRVAELFEARSPKDAGMLAEVTGTVSFGKDTKGKQRLVITDLDGVAHEYLIPKDKHVTAHDGQVVNKGEIDRRRSGGSARHPAAARRRGARALHHRRSAGRLPAAGREDQRQAHRGDRAADAAPRGQSHEPGDTRFIVGEQVERSELLDENDRVSRRTARSRRTYEHMLLGITKASLSTDSFISAASFQETTRVLTEAAIMGKKDDLRGLKENVIVGRLIPAGTGLAYHTARKRQRALEAAGSAGGAGSRGSRLPRKRSWPATPDGKSTESGRRASRPSVETKKRESPRGAPVFYGENAIEAFASASAARESGPRGCVRAARLHHHRLRQEARAAGRVHECPDVPHTFASLSTPPRCSSPRSPSSRAARAG